MNNELHLKYINRREGIRLIAIENGIVVYENNLLLDNIEEIINGIYKKRRPDPGALFKSIHFVRGCAKRLSYSCESKSIRYNAIFLKSVLQCIAQSNL